MMPQVIRVSPFKSLREFIKMARGLVLLSFALLVSLFLLGDYGAKTREVTRHQAATAAGHFRPVIRDYIISNVRYTHEYFEGNGRVMPVITYDASWFKDEDRVYCIKPRLLADSRTGNLNVVNLVKPTARPAGHSFAKNVKIFGAYHIDDTRIYTKHFCDPEWPTTTLLKDYGK